MVQEPQAEEDAVRAFRQRSHGAEDGGPDAPPAAPGADAGTSQSPAAPSRDGSTPNDPEEDPRDAALEHAEDILWVACPLTGRLRYVGPAFMRLTGRHEPPALPQQWADILHPDDRRRFREGMDRMLQGKTDRVDCLARLRHADGSWRWTRNRARLVRGEDGEPRHIVGTIGDVTHEQEATEALLASEATLRGMVENSPAALLRLDGGLHVQDANPACVALLGHADRSTLLAAEPAWLFPDDGDRARMVAALGGSMDHVVEVRRADGTRFRARLRLRGRPGAGTGPTILDGSLEDVDGDEAAREALKQSADMLGRLLDAAPEPVWVVDRHLRLVRCNPRAREYLEHHEEGPVRVGGPVPMQAPWGDAYRRVLAGEGPVRVGLDSHGARQAALAPLGRDAVAVYLRAPRNDPERLERMLEGLRRSNRELEQFAAVASHDLQEPLRTLAGLLQLLERRDAVRQDAEGLRYLQEATEASRRMKTLTEDLLTLSRVATLPKPHGPVDLEDALQEAKRMIRGRIEDAGARIEHDALPTVRGDSGQIVLLLQNLVSNAVKFRGAHPAHVHVDAVRQGPAWRIRVADNGIGIEPGLREEVFQPFRRLHPRERYEGNGVGLAVCRAVVDRHGGTIGVEAREGGGSVFWFTLPAMPDADDASGGTAPAVDGT